MFSEEVTTGHCNSVGLLTLLFAGGLDASFSTDRK